jgi:methylated-DNA-protein-cysteine methyltransferase related protein
MSMWNPPDKGFFETVWLIVKQIPHGKVSTYGQIASMIPPAPDEDAEQHLRLAPRWVGTAMRKVDPDVPWQRVINSQGKISLPDENGIRQRSLLEDEGVKFNKAGVVDLEVYGWEGPDDAWLEEHNLLPPNSFNSKPRQKPLF